MVLIHDFVSYYVKVERVKVVRVKVERVKVVRVATVARSRQW